MHVAGMSHQFGRRLERIGQDAHAHVALAQVLEHLHPFVARYEVGRDHQQFGLHRRRGLGHGAVHQHADHLAFFDALLLRAVVDQLRMRPDERQPAGDHSGKRLAGRDAARIVGAVRLHLPAMLVQGLAIRVQRGVRLLSRWQAPRPGSPGRCSRTRRTSSESCLTIGPAAKTSSSPNWDSGSI